MYGLIFTTLKSLIVDKICGGDEGKWKEICMKAEINRVEFFNNEYYDENFLDKLVAAASEVLGIKIEKALEAFGGEFFAKTKVSGHSHMLRTLGNNLFGFLVNLDSLHSHLSFTYVEMQAPSFQCDITDEGLQLHYYSHRFGLHPVVTGIVKAVAKDFFSLEIEMNKYLEEKLEGVKLCYHYGYEITVQECSKDETWLERLQGERNVSYVPAFLQFPGSRNSANLSVLLDSDSFLKASASFQQMSHCPFSSKRDSEDILSNVDEKDSLEEIDSGEPTEVKSSKKENRIDNESDTDTDGGKDEENSTVGIAPLPYRHLLPSHFAPGSPVMSRSASRRASIFIPTDDWPITITTFRTCFPFHIIFDSNLTITFMGVSMTRLFPNAITQQKKLGDLFEVERPAIPSLAYNHIRSRSHNQFVLKASKTAKSESNPLLFRGQMVPINQRSPFTQILFLGSPRVKEIDELKKHGLYLSDIPIHDVTREMILLHHQLEAEMTLVTELERVKRLLEEEQMRVKIEKDRADKLLHAMLPESVARALKDGKGAQATFHPEVTILFSDIEGFTTICNKCHPLQVVNMLNDLYTKFDSHIDECKVYKVETIGDAYMVAAGLLDTSDNHAYSVIRFSFLMREGAQMIKRPTDDSPLKIRIGIHTGAVMAGVVGQKMPRYCLFGDTVNLASRMESHGEPGKIHVSENTYRLLHEAPIKFICRGKIRVKGLERRKMTYFVEPLAEGEEPITEYISSEMATDSDNDGSTSAHGGSGPLKGNESSTSLLLANKNRSPSVSTNVSFSLISGDMPSSSDSNHSLKRKSHKVSIESNSSVNHAITVPIIEEPCMSTVPSSTSLGTTTSSIRRNQVSPAANDGNSVMQGESSFAENGATSLNSDSTSKRGKNKRKSRKNCSIC